METGGSGFKASGGSMSQASDSSIELLNEIAHLRARVDEMDRRLAEQQQAWHSLREDQEAIEVLLNAIPEAAFLIDPDGIILEANETMANRFGLTRQELVGRCAFDLLPPELAEQRRRHAQLALETGRQKRFIDRRGDRMIDNIICPVVGPDGRVTRLAMLGIDVTERENAQEALRRSRDELENHVAQRTADLEIANRKLQEEISERRRAETAARESQRLLEMTFTGLHEGLFIIDANSTRILDCNPAACEIFGYRREDLIGREPVILYENERAMREFQIWMTRANEQGSLLYPMEVTMRHQDGTFFPAEHTALPLRNEDNRPTGWVYVTRNIARRKRAETDRDALREQLHQVQKMEALGQLAAGVAHDFHNLITVIRGYATQACASLLPDHAARQALRSILDATQQASGLARSLQTFSRKMPIEKRPVDLCRVVNDAVRLIRPTLPASITLEVDNPCDLPLWVEADPSQLHQVLLNLALNARDAMPDGGQLHVAVRASHPEPGRRSRTAGKATVIVTDTGVGIPPENLQRVFEPFFTTKPRERNCGLGLSIVQTIVEEHRGTIEVASRPGQGTTFTVSLPQTEPGQTSGQTDQPQEMPRGNGELILLAESDPHLGGIIALTLESLGYEVMQAADGRFIPEIARKRRERLRLLILEADLPGCHGVTCLRLLQEEGLLPPAIVLTGQSEPQDSEIPADVSTLARPFEMPELARTVYNVIHADTQKETGD